MSKKTIAVKCKGAESPPIDVILEFQGKLKKLTKDNLEKLKRRIADDGFIAPIFVWENGGDYFVLDGHQRLQALLSLREDGYDMPMIPVAYIEAADEAEARQRLLSITSQYGEFDGRELKEWMDQIDVEVAETLRFVDGELSVLKIDYDAEWEGMPEYDTVDKTSAYKIVVHFDSEDAVKEFAEKLGINITEKTNSTWYPQKENDVLKDKAYV